MGYSVGKWDGDDFVVHRGVNDAVWNIDLFRHPHSDALRITERYHRVDFGHMDVQVTIDDSKTYVSAWNMPVMRFTLLPDTDLFKVRLREKYRSATHGGKIKSREIKGDEMKHFDIRFGWLSPGASLLCSRFDSNKPVELKGTLIELEWVNPHAWIHMEVTDASGKVTKWDCELGSPNLLMRNGWRKDVLKKGDKIIVIGAQAKDASNLARPHRYVGRRQARLQRRFIGRTRRPRSRRRSELNAPYPAAPSSRPVPACSTARPR